MAHVCGGLTWGVCGVVATCAILFIFALLYCVCCIIICSRSRWCRRKDKRQFARRRPCRTVVVGVESEVSSEVTDDSHLTGTTLPTCLLVSSPPGYDEALALPLPHGSVLSNPGVPAPATSSHRQVVNGSSRMSVQSSLAALTGGQVTPSTRSAGAAYLRLPSYEEYCGKDSSHGHEDRYSNNQQQQHAMA